MMDTITTNYFDDSIGMQDIMRTGNSIVYDSSLDLDEADVELELELELEHNFSLAVIHGLKEAIKVLKQTENDELGNISTKLNEMSIDTNFKTNLIKDLEIDNDILQDFWTHEKHQMNGFIDSMPTTSSDSENSKTELSASTDSLMDPEWTISKLRYGSRANNVRPFLFEKTSKNRSQKRNDELATRTANEECKYSKDGRLSHGAGRSSDLGIKRQRPGLGTMKQVLSFPRRDVMGGSSTLTVNDTVSPDNIKTALDITEHNRSPQDHLPFPLELQSLAPGQSSQMNQEVELGRRLSTRPTTAGSQSFLSSSLLVGEVSPHVPVSSSLKLMDGSLSFRNDIQSLCCSLEDELHEESSKTTIAQE